MWGFSISCWGNLGELGRTAGLGECLGSWGGGWSQKSRAVQEGRGWRGPMLEEG